MKDHKAQAASTVVTSDMVQGRWTSIRKLQILGAAFAVVILLGVAGYLIHLGMQRETSNKLSAGKQYVNPFTPQAQLNSAKADVTGASSMNDKVNAYLSLGGAYLDNNQLQSAITAYQEADTLSNGQNLEALIQLAALYNMTKQRPELVATLQHIIALMEQQSASNPYTYRQGGQLPWYQDALTRVQGGGWL